MSPPPPDIMVTIGLLLHLFSHGSMLAAAAAASSASSLDCVAAEQGCVQEQACMVLYRVLEYCAAEEAVAPLGADARWECLEAQNSLQQYRPLQVCKCQRGSRREEHCLRVYWTVRFAAYEEYDVSPYEELELNLVRHIEMSRMASIMAASSLTLDGQNQCLKAAQDCGLYEKCGSLRSEYVVACTKRVPGGAGSSDGGGGSCNRQKCHRALRRFLERVPEEYSFALLFCPCSDTLCGERRRKTIVPSCSYEEQAAAAARGGEERAAAAAAAGSNNNNKPNCLSLQNYCTRDELCRSRLADFQHNCQSSPQSPSGCVRESRAMCLKAYAGLIGTIMTPNYVSNSTMDVSQWCGCEGSGNEWQGCQRILHMFTSNVCLRNAISSMGSAAGAASASPPHPAVAGGGSTPVTPAAAAASRPSSSPRVYQERERGGGGDHAPRTHLNSMEESEEDEEDEDEMGVEDQSRKFNVIPPYSEKDNSAVEPVAKGSHRGAAHRALMPMLPLMLLALVGPGLLLCWG